MSKIVLLTSVKGKARGDFYAGKKLIKELTGLGHHVEWLLQYSDTELDSLNIDDLKNDNFQFLPFSDKLFDFYPELSIFENKTGMALKRVKKIKELGKLLSQRDLVIVFPCLLFLYKNDYNIFIEQGVNMVTIAEYGFDRDDFFVQNPYFADWVNHLSSLKIPTYFTGVVPNKKSEKLLCLTTDLKKESNEKLNIDVIIKNYAYLINDVPLPMIIKDKEDYYILGIDEKGGFILTEVPLEHRALYSHIDYILPPEKQKIMCGIIKPLSERSLLPNPDALWENIQQLKAHSISVNGIFLTDEAKLAQINFNTIIHNKDKPFLIDLLNITEENDFYSQIASYNESHACFFSYTNSTMVKGHDEDLAAYFFFCVKLAIKENKKNIDLIGKVNENVKSLLSLLLSNIALEEPLNIRFFNPFPLANDTMQWLMKLAGEKHKHPILITGDQSAGEALGAALAFTYQAPPWKITFANSLISLCEINNYQKVKAFLNASMLGYAKRFQLSAIDNIVDLALDPMLYEEFSQLRKVIPSLAERITFIFPKDLPCKNLPLESLNVFLAESSAKIGKNKIHINMYSFTRRGFKTIKVASGITVFEFKKMCFEQLNIEVGALHYKNVNNRNPIPDNQLLLGNNEFYYTTPVLLNCHTAQERQVNIEMQKTSLPLMPVSEEDEKVSIASIKGSDCLENSSNDGTEPDPKTLSPVQGLDGDTEASFEASKVEKSKINQNTPENSPILPQTDMKNALSTKKMQTQNNFFSEGNKLSQENPKQGEKSLLLRKEEKRDCQYRPM